MNVEKLSKRLELVANAVPKDARVADIGSDHAYLPCYLALNEQITYAVAGEVVDGPFQSACLHVKEQGLAEKVFVRLADGLDAIEELDKIDTVTICGMGGDLISKILERGYIKGQLKTVNTLILQPNIGEQHVRKWLMAHQYKIIEEYIIEENKKIYEVIVATVSKDVIKYSLEQLQFGVFLPDRKETAFVQKWMLELDKYESVIKQLKQAKTDESEKILLFREKQRVIKEMLSNAHSK
ncbi:tRNA (adenine(22)-N(1))-methyltransferase TrmK [Granulicatella sp. zg-ZJ]|uniref:tRNA (adenine(22)-N(1))-methyltransferase n=1 Tax=Granulicatella sp. zg-ZJ TaxID=2678504 RepID=UPI0013D0B547|nr:tRNA (adenine(22)-N(1))-methyltransferase TrmK [Granulicatella sp. zg-ZJ]MBS4750844.1 tRNA (adenine(22)-N(1))-methyltransferase TrmK [Carnobacteriaceae bacterium zg-ZUI78]NEW62251.1 tRNA (adenine(22)-N(1))-methyltransferase TrmK [Granulicatella sp. zg-ZJ]